MAKGCKKCDPHEICEECPEWIFTLADLIMCMMGLFVLLWVLKPTGNPDPATGAAVPQEQSQEWLEMVGEIRAGFGYVPDPNSADPVDTAMIKKRMRLAGPGEKGTQTISQEAVEGTDPTVTNIRESRISAVGTRVLFERGQSRLTPTHERVLDDIAAKIRGMRFIVQVKGHASRDDYVEEATAQQLMDISIRRAQAAADYLVTKGVSPEVIRVQGCSSFEPVQQRAYSPESQRLNRRVEVFSTDLTVRDLQDPPKRSEQPLD
ncbi:MAG TPA: OmpA family protein [Tepidisphaeraceae bacterium]|jgi:outer membrane protein OmpA-like peptidoglycan-associated protein